MTGTADRYAGSTLGSYAGLRNYHYNSRTYNSTRLARVRLLLLLVLLLLKATADTYLSVLLGCQSLELRPSALSTVDVVARLLGSRTVSADRTACPCWADKGPTDNRRLKQHHAFSCKLLLIL